MKRGKRNICLLMAVFAAGVVMLTGAASTAVSVQTERVSGGQLIRSVLVQATVCRAREEAYLSPKTGRVTNVFVQEGQHVQQGELLFQMDVSQEAQALAALYQKWYAYEQTAAQMDESLMSLSLSQSLEWYESEQQLLTSVRLSAVRAQADGVVSAVYVTEGETAAQGSVLGLGGSEQICFAIVTDQQDVLELRPGAAAVLRDGERYIPVVFERTESVEERPQERIVYFEPPVEADIGEYQAGMSIQMELIYGAVEAEALLPFEAIDAEGNAWYVEEGRAFSEAVVFEQNSRTHAAAAEAWNGREVILWPDSEGLTDGTRVLVER